MSKRLISKLEKIIEDARKEIRFDVNKGKNFKKATQTRSVPDLSDLWYETQAEKFVSDFGKDIEDNWEEKIVNQWCDSQRVSWGFEIDKVRLWKAIKEILKTREDDFLDRQRVTLSLNEISQNLLREAEREEELEKLIVGCSAGSLFESVYDKNASYDKISLEDFKQACGTRCSRDTFERLAEEHSGQEHRRRVWEKLYDDYDYNHE